MKTYATLKPDTPYNSIFPDGKVPIISIFPITPHKSGSPLCYVVNSRELTDNQIAMLAEMLYETWKPLCTSIDEARDYISSGLPLKCDWFEFVTYSGTFPEPGQPNSLVNCQFTIIN